MGDQQTRDELNRLYWETDESVADIADRMDMSRRALYEEIDPLPAGAPCPECGAPLGYRNRTSLANEEVECPRCGHETEMPAVDPATTTEQQGAAAALSPVRRVPEGSSGALGGLVLVAGLGVGAVLAYWLRRS